MNLLCAEGLRGSENLNVEDCLRTLDAWTDHVKRETKRNFHHFLERPKKFNSSIPYYQLGMMGTVLAEDMRIRYNPERERQLLEKPVNQQTIEDENVFFSSSADVFIHGLLTGKHYGTCASMPFLYAAVGRRLGYPVAIAARKYHLYLRYEGGNGEHLNMEATENRGFATPTDEEYRHGKYPMTQEEIDGCGWLRPLSNKEILGICLLTRAHCLRSMKNYDMETTTLSAAARYLPDTALMSRVIAKNQELARNLHAADRWDEVWTEVETLRLPTAGPKFEHFQNAKLSVQLFMNQSTNLAEIEKSVSGLKADLRRYQAEISDDLGKSTEAYGRPQPIPPNQLPFLALLQDGPQPRRIRIPQEIVPAEYYWNGIPPELQARLLKLTKEDEIIEEMNVFAAEEINLRNLGTKQAVNIRQRRGVLEQQPVTQMSLQIEIVPTTGGNGTGFNAAKTAVDPTIRKADKAHNNGHRKTMKAKIKFLVVLLGIFTVTQAQAMRWYSPNTGSWFSRDPIGEMGGLNLHVFVTGDPVNSIDFIGLCKCGPDVTDALNIVLNEIRQTYAKWEPAQKLSACTAIIGLNPKVDHTGAWDIEQLANHTEGYNKADPNYGGKDPISHGAGEGCKFTVQVGGQCFHAGAVNYAMWGTMWNLCQDAGVPGNPFQFPGLMEAAIKKHKRGFWNWPPNSEDEIEAIDFAHYPGQHRTSRTECALSDKKFTGKFTWEWAPIKQPTIPFPTPPNAIPPTPKAK